MLEDLGLKAFPSTATGKIREDLLRKTLFEFDALSKKHEKSAPDAVSGIAEAVLAIWSELLSTPVSELELHIPIDQLADSLTVTRVRGLLRKRLQRDIPESVLNCPGGIAEQITLMKDIGQHLLDQLLLLRNPKAHHNWRQSYLLVAQWKSFRAYEMPQQSWESPSISAGPTSKRSIHLQSNR